MVSGGLAALGVPVFVHLLRRHTTTPRPVSSLMFFERGTQSSTRHRRLRYLLLFVACARMLLLSAGAGVCQSLHPARPRACNSDKLMLIVLDNSFSMRAGTRFADAKQRGACSAGREGLATERRSWRSAAQIAGADAADRRTGALRAAVESIQPGDSHANFGELAHGGPRAGGDRAHANRSAPLQRHAEIGMPANFSRHGDARAMYAVLHPVANGGHAELDGRERERPGATGRADPKKSRVQAVIAGYRDSRGYDDGFAGGERQDRRDAARWMCRRMAGRRWSFQSLDVPYGLNRCAVRIDSADGFPADDASVFCGETGRSGARAVCAPGQRYALAALLWRGAGCGESGVVRFAIHRSEQTADMDPTKYAFVVLSDAVALPSIFENTLTRYVAAAVVF